MKETEPDEIASADWRGEFQADVTIRDRFDIRVDELEEVGGSDTGPMPSELLLASLSSCMCLALSFVASKRNVTLPDLSIEARGYDDPGGFRFSLIEVEITSTLDETELSSMLESATDYCYVSNTLENGCEIDYTTQSSDRLI